MLWFDPSDYKALSAHLSGFLEPGEQFHRNILIDRLYASLPTAGEVKVQIYNAEIAPGGFTNWHCHNGATFFLALQGVFEAQFRDPGIVVRARAGEVYSEPVARIHRGHNPHPDLAYLCVGFCVTAPDLEHVTNVAELWSPAAT